MKILGHVEHKVKSGKFQVTQNFTVVSEPVAGYDCLLGEDFFVKHSCGISYSALAVKVHLGAHADGSPVVVLNRRLDTSSPCELQHNDVGTCHVPAALSFHKGSATSKLAGLKESRRLLK